MSISTAPPATDGDWGPATRGGRRRRRWLVVALVALLGLPMLYGLALAARVNGAVNRIPVAGLAAGGGPLHVLVIGSDSREDLTEEEQAALGTGYVEGERTDSIFILAIDGDNAGLLAFPRDLYVTRCDGSEGRINAALSRGGPECLVRTVSALSGIDIDHYLAVSFGGFVDIVDAVGGVDLCLERALNDPFAGIDLPAGCQTLAGRQALGYVRTRKLDNDLERIKRQQAFLGALADELARPATLVHPGTAFSVTGAVGRALTADDGLGLFDLLRMARGLRGLAGGAVTATVPATPASIGGASVLVPNLDAAAPIFAGFRDGSLLAPPGDLTPADVRVRVLNGAGVSGLAGATRDALAARGYQVVGIGDADRTATSTVRYPTGARAAAEVLARDLPIAVELVESASADTVTLVLGEDLADGV